MRIFKKVLTVVCVLALLTAGFVFAAFAEDEVLVGNVEELKALVVDAQNADDVDDKYDAILAIAEYLNTREMDPSESGYSKTLKEAKVEAITCYNNLIALVKADKEANGGVFTDDALISANERLAKVSTLFGLFEYNSSLAGQAAAKADYTDLLNEISTLYIANLEETFKNAETLDPETGEVTDTNTALTKIALNKVNKLFNECEPLGRDVEKESVFVENKAKFDEYAEKHEAASKAKYAMLDGENLYTNYDLPVYYENGWEGINPKVYDSSIEVNKTVSWQVVLSGAKNQALIEQEENGNTYYTHRYTDNSYASYIQANLKDLDTDFSADDGLVFEFDITTFGEFPTGGTMIEPGGVTLPEGRKFPVSYFFMNGNGDICNPEDEKTVILENAIVRGEWLHITIVFDPGDDFTYSLYVEGQFIAKYTAKVLDGKLTYDHKEVTFRISGKASTSGEVSYDNIKIYPGNSYRVQNKIQNMTDDEKFLYAIDYMRADNGDIFGKNEAHKLATDLLSNYCTKTDEGYELKGLATENEEYANAVKFYMEEFDLEKITAELKSDNLDEFIRLVEELAAVKRSPSTVGERDGKIELIQKFVTKNGTFIDNLGDTYPKAEEEGGINGNGIIDYTEYNDLLTDIILQTAQDKNVNTFIKYMSRLQTATTLTAMERYYNNAKKLINDGGIDVGFINDMIADENHESRAEFKDLIDAYNVYLNAYKSIDALNKTKNAEAIVTCIDYIRIYDTEQKWLDNADIINTYIGIVKPLALGTDSEGNPLYDTTYSGIDNAIRFFNEVYLFFYELEQDDHVAYIKGVLDNIRNTTSYIEKMGMTAAIQRYLDTNEIDYTDERIVSLINDFETCKFELTLREEDYGLLLIQNSVYFNNFVEKMRTAEKYEDQKAFFEEAALLYFNIDASVEGTDKAIVIFDEFAIKLAEIERASIKFIEAVAIYNASEDEDAKYAALVECYANAKNANLSYEGVAEAMAEYTAAYDAYMNYANAVNETLAVSGHAVGSVRANCGITLIIAIIVKKIFGV